MLKKYIAHNVSGWGRYPQIESQVILPSDASEINEALLGYSPFAIRGLGRSYGDSSLGENILSPSQLNHLQSFDPDTGILKCMAGCTLADIQYALIPHGWFLPVSPGTKFVTIGGAIASDVHGKNHHLVGTFSEHVLDIDLMLGNGEVLKIDKFSTPDLFRATCGGMGLTGIIMSASLKLIPITSNQITQTSMKLPNLEAVLNAFDENHNASYSVAWIDCLAKGKHLGKSILMLGEHAPGTCLSPKNNKSITIPFDLPQGLMNAVTVGTFNALYYRRPIKSVSNVSLESFFYPLDKLLEWNRLYGKQGFLQYQFAIPLKNASQCLNIILTKIAHSGGASFLAVLKRFGKANSNFLSFPIEGYTLALDFKVTPQNLMLLNELDQVILEFGGRLYLTKDARMSKTTFKFSYPLWGEFEEVRAKYHAIGKFSSLQSKRLGLQ
jgi:decaprenylphospho-beta-D-ribofuranose 2-oxidase